MSNAKINDRALLRMVDIEGLSQSAAAVKFGVSRQAVSRKSVGNLLPRQVVTTALAGDGRQQEHTQ